MQLKGKKVFVTGSDGFIGSHLTEMLIDLGCDVKAFVYYNSFNSLGWLDTIPKEKLRNLEVFSGDVRDPNGVRKAITDVEVVFHLAALIGIPYSYHSPDSYVDTNLKGTLNILQACRDHSVSRLVVTSTSEVYGSARYVPIDETHPKQAQSPYSATKIGADAIADSFFRSFDLPVTIARPFNTFGPRQSARAIVPTVFTQLLKGTRHLRLGSLVTTRDLTYVTDTCAGFVALAECDEALGREVNIGTGEEISVGNLARLIMEIVEHEAEIVTEEARVRPEKSEVGRLVCDNRLIRELTGWAPQVPLRQGLVKTAEWFRKIGNLGFYKTDVYNI